MVDAKNEGSRLGFALMHEGFDVRPYSIDGGELRIGWTLLRPA